MTTRRLRVLAVALAAMASAAHAQDVPIELLPSDLKWTPAPADVAPGAQAAVLAGPLDKPVHYTLRVRLAKGGMVTPHKHSDTRHITVLSGHLYAGTGSTISEATSKRFPPGSFFVVPAGTVHYAWAKDNEVMYQESGVGPTGTEFEAVKR